VLSGWLNNLKLLTCLPECAFSDVLNLNYQGQARESLRYSQKPILILMSSSKLVLCQRNLFAVGASEATGLRVSN
jgi:hypothetical protein